MKERLDRLGSALGLRATITTIVVLIGALAILSAALLGGLTTLIRRSGEEVAISTLSLRLVEAAEVELLLHARTVDGAVKAAHEGELWRRINQVAEHVTSAEEAAVFSRAHQQVASYLETSRAEPAPSETAASGEALAAAFSALEALADVNSQQSRDAASRAASTDRLASVLGLVLLLTVGSLVAALLWWLWRRALAPILELGEAMRAFGEGNRGARARLGGAAELRGIARQFNEMADELSRQREAQMTFLAGVAHDLRNPLAPIKTAVTLLASERQGSSQSAALLRVLERQVDHLERLIGDLLEIARIEAGRLDLRLEEVDARSLAEEAVELYRPAAPNIALEVSTPDAAVPLICDPIRVQQVLNNLISNAIKYSPEGGRVAVAVDHGCDHVAFSVRDGGRGIARQELERLFEPFRRADRSADSPVPGEGLGLFVVRRIVEAHSGRLEVSSVEGEGSTFRVELPVATAGGATLVAESRAH